MMGWFKRAKAKRTERRIERALKQREAGKAPGYIERLTDARVTERTGYVSPRESDFTQEGRR